LVTGDEWATNGIRCFQLVTLGEAWSPVLAGPAGAVRQCLDDRARHHDRERGTAFHIGVAVYAGCRALLPDARGSAANVRLDLAGAVTVTSALMLAVYAIVNGNEAGWTSVQSLGLLGTAVVLLVLFLFIEVRVPAPLMPPGLFRLRNVAVANVVDRRPNSTLRAWSPRRSGNSPLKPCALKRAAMRLPCPR
jgi:hypothetical protein